MRITLAGRGIGVHSRTDNVVIRIGDRTLEHWVVYLRICQRVIDELWLRKERGRRCCGGGE
jgi:hypothetical protein